MKQIKKLIVLSLIFIGSCTQNKIEFHVTKPAELPIKKIKNLAIGDFEDQMEVSIPLPDGNILKKGGLLKSNQSVSDLLRAHLLNSLSKGGDYRIINTSSHLQGITGLIPNANETGIIQAKVRFYENIIEGNDVVFHVLLIRNENLPLEQRLAILGGSTLIATAAERSGKGFKVPIPYVEEIAAIEVEFDFIRQSDGSKIIPTQTFRNYFYKKWGGDDKKSNFLLEVIDQITKAQGLTNSFFAELEGIAKNLEQQVIDPYEFEAKGLHLKHNPEVPWVSLDIQNFIVSKIAREFAQKISKTHEIASLELASGDHQGIILIQGNAYELAINHLENLPQPLSPADSYNLGLAYEAIGEYTQAAKHYQNGLKREVDNSQLKEALLRIKR